MGAKIQYRVHHVKQSINFCCLRAMMNKIWPNTFFKQSSKNSSPNIVDNFASDYCSWRFLVQLIQLDLCL